MTYESLLKLAREGKTIWVKVKNFKVAHQVSGFSNVEYCVNGGFYRYDADKFELLTGEPGVESVISNVDPSKWEVFPNMAAVREKYPEAKEPE